MQSLHPLQSSSNHSRIDQALASYASASKHYTPAHHSDISAYRTWMTEHEPVDEPESRFLENDEDLMILKTRKPSPITPIHTLHPPDPPQNEKFLLFAALLIPPIAISLVQGILAKVVIMAILAFTGFIILESQPPTTATPCTDKGEDGVSEETKDDEVNEEKCKNV